MTETDRPYQPVPIKYFSFDIFTSAGVTVGYISYNIFNACSNHFLSFFIRWLSHMSLVIFYFSN